MDSFSRGVPSRSGHADVSDSGKPQEGCSQENSRANRVKRHMPPNVLRKIVLVPDKGEQVAEGNTPLRNFAFACYKQSGAGSCGVQDFHPAMAACFGDMKFFGTQNAKAPAATSLVVRVGQLRV